MTAIAAAIAELRTSHAATTQGSWGKGKTSHHTASKRGAGQPYHVAEFRHADDAQFCDLAHAKVPALCDEVERLQAARDELLAALVAMDEAMCNAGNPHMSAEMRAQGRQAIIATRAAIAKHKPAP